MYRVIRQWHDLRELEKKLVVIAVLSLTEVPFVGW